jgi:hypothetical protein
MVGISYRASWNATRNRTRDSGHGAMAVGREAGLGESKNVACVCHGKVGWVWG